LATGIAYTAVPCSGALESAEAPEDWSGSVDVESTDDNARGGSDSLSEERDLRASSLDGIDLFD
jgi:hypothetical protein